MRATSQWWSLLVLPSSLFFAVASLIAKHTTVTQHVIQLCLWRYIALCVGGWIMLTIQGIPVRNTHLKVHFSRALWGSLSILLYFFSLKILPATLAIALFHTSPIFVLFLLFLQQKNKTHIPWLIVMCAMFCGALINIQPNLAGTTISASLCLVGAFLSAVSFTRVSLLGRLGEPVGRIIFFLGLFGTLVTFAIGFIGKWILHLSFLEPTSWKETGLMCLIALCSLVGQSSLFTALIRGHILYSASLISTDILFSVLMSFCFLSVHYSTVEIIGFAIIALFSFIARFLVSREAAREKSEK